MQPQINEILVRIKQKKPFVFNCTHSYPMELVASGVRSIGAFLITSNARQECADLLTLSGAVVINLGKLGGDFLDLCSHLCRMANELGLPVILDPVGAGASEYRTKIALDVINSHKISVIRGYPNEIASLLTGKLNIQQGNLIDGNSTLENAKLLSKMYHTTVVVSGKRHMVIEGNKMDQCNFDSLLLQKVAGISTLLSSIIAVFHAVEQDSFIAAKMAVKFYAHCVGPVSSVAAGPASLMTGLIDQLYINSIAAVG